MWMCVYVFGGVSSSSCSNYAHRKTASDNQEEYGNDEEELVIIPEEDRRQEVKNQDLMTDSLPTKRALGIQWNLEHDYLGFCVHLKDTPLTRRGMLSIVSSIYDLLDFVAPFILPVRKIIQRLCQGEVKWDDPVSCDIRKDWKEWKSYLSSLGDITVNRCFKPSNFKLLKR